MNNYRVILQNNNLRICKDRIIRDSKNHPILPNDIYQDLVIKKQQGNLTPNDDDLYGSCVMTLTEIVLNCRKMKFQNEDVKDDCRCEAIIALLDAVPRYFKPEKGSKVYSFAYRICYTAMIHVLEKYNRTNEMMETLLQAFEMFRDSTRFGKKVSNININS